MPLAKATSSSLSGCACDKQAVPVIAVSSNGSIPRLNEMSTVLGGMVTGDEDMESMALWRTAWWSTQALLMEA